MSDYEQGKAAGLADGLIISQPINTGGHTFEEWSRVRDTYAQAISFGASDWQRGYADGLDQRAIEAGYGDPTEEQIDAFYDNL
jgi:hypothetical protein